MITYAFTDISSSDLSEYSSSVESSVETVEASFTKISLAFSECPVEGMKKLVISPTDIGMETGFSTTGCAESNKK